MEPPHCCVCASANQNCVTCACVRAKRSCVNCKRGANCQNAVIQIQDGADRHQPQGVQGDNPNDTVGDSQENLNGDATRELRFWQRWTHEEAENWIHDAYNQIATFSPNNIFEPPRCNATKALIEEKTFLIRAYTNSTQIAPLALKILAVLPHLICQRTHRTSKRSEDIKAVQRRMELWKRGDVSKLLDEARTLQQRLHKGKGRKNNSNDRARDFAEKMRQGKVAMATRSLAGEEEAAGVLPMTAETRQTLKDKHPHARPAPPEMRFPGTYRPPHRVVFEHITGDVIWKHALHTHGAAGPSGMDAKGWKSLLSKNIFGNVSVDLRDAIAGLAKKMASDNCQNLGALMACRLIPLDKKPGCRPIGIGEVLRRIIGKAVMEVVKDDIRKVVGNLQVCAGQQAGCEAAIHAVRRMFQDQECQAVLMVDASNAFNNINREATLHNIKMKCPIFAMYVENMYKEPAKLFISSRADQTLGNPEVIESSEGTTQGDPVAMAMYALGMMRLQDIIRHENTSVKQVAYADDLTGVGKATDLKQWWDLVQTYGPQIGYFPNAAKSVLIVKPEHYEQANSEFRSSGVKVTKAGERHLGAAIGTKEFRDAYVEHSVKNWVSELTRLSDYAKTEPQAAYAAFTYGIKQKWNYLMRTVPGISCLLRPLEEAVRNTFIPAITNGRCPNDQERKLLELPPRMGGLGITNPQDLAESEFENSLRLTATLTGYIVDQNETGEDNPAEIRMIRNEITKQREAKQRDLMQELIRELPEETKRRVEMAQEVGASNWLTTLPIRAKGFTLNKKEFTDAIALRYGWPIEGIPSTCACGLPFNQTHAMTCKTGGFICMRHDEVRDVTAQMLKEVCHDVTVEPVLLPLQGEQLARNTSNTLNDARVDVSARGFWTRRQRAYFDIRIFDPMARCHRDLPLDAAHRRNEQEKLRAYEERIQNVDQGSFTPLVFTTSGGMGPRAQVFYARLAETLSEVKQQPRSSVVAWMRCRLSFSLLRSALVCLRGTRTPAPRATHIADLDFEATVVDSRINHKLC